MATEKVKYERVISAPVTKIGKEIRTRKDDGAKFYVAYPEPQEDSDGVIDLTTTIWLDADWVEKMGADTLIGKRFKVLKRV